MKKNGTKPKSVVKNTSRGINPMLERSPDPFPETRTIPDGWDLYDLLRSYDQKQEASFQGVSSGKGSGSTISRL